MQRILVTLFAALFTFVLLPVPDAEAKRFGGGRSSGLHRDSLPQRQAAPQRNADNPGQQQAAGAPASPAGKRSWLGPVAGLAAGLGLAALASHLGLGEEVASFLLIALLLLGGVVLFRLLRRGRMQPERAGMQYAGSGAGAPGGQLAGGTEWATAAAGSSTGTGPVSTLPPGFDAEAFLRQAKLNFIRLQAAYDAADLEDIRAFTSPEMYAEIKLQLAERGDAAQRTEVMTLEAEVLECVEEPERYLVSVRFHGLIREETNAPPLEVNEVWHLTKPADGSRGWVVAGIQQVQ